MSTRECPLCTVYFPDSEPRLPRRPQVCDGDRFRLDRTLGDIADYHARLVNPDPVERDNRWYAVKDRRGRLTGERRRADPVAGVGGAGPVPAREIAPPVTGSRERSAPVDLDRIDLTGPARPDAVRDTLVPAVAVTTSTLTARRLMWLKGEPTVREDEVTVRHAAVLRGDDGQPLLVPAGDQIGHLSAATVLDLWAGWWRDSLWPGYHLPPTTVDDLVGWMHERVDDACDRFAAIGDCAAELRALCSVLRAACDETEPVPQVLLGERCPECHQVSTLERMPGDRYAECHECGLLLSGAELEEWLQQPAGEGDGGTQKSAPRPPGEGQDAARFEAEVSGGSETEQGGQGGHEPHAGEQAGQCQPAPVEAAARLA